MTARQASYVEELEVFERRGRLQAWQATKAEIDAVRMRLHDRALPLASSDDPSDLLELLTAESSPVTRPAPMNRPAIAPQPATPRRAEHEPATSAETAAHRTGTPAL